MSLLSTIARSIPEKLSPFNWWGTGKTTPAPTATESPQDSVGTVPNTDSLGPFTATHFPDASQFDTRPSAPISNVTYDDQRAITSKMADVQARLQRKYKEKCGVTDEEDLCQISTLMTLPSDTETGDATKPVPSLPDATIGALTTNPGTGDLSEMLAWDDPESAALRLQVRKFFETSKRCEAMTWKSAKNEKAFKYASQVAGWAGSSFNPPTGDTALSAPLFYKAVTDADALFMTTISKLPDPGGCISREEASNMATELTNAKAALEDACSKVVSEMRDVQAPYVDEGNKWLDLATETDQQIMKELLGRSSVTESSNLKTQLMYQTMRKIIQNGGLDPSMLSGLSGATRSRKSKAKSGRQTKPRTEGTTGNGMSGARSVGSTGGSGKSAKSMERSKTDQSSKRICKQRGRQRGRDGEEKTDASSEPDSIDDTSSNVDKGPPRSKRLPSRRTVKEGKVRSVIQQEAYDREQKRQKEAKDRGGFFNVTEDQMSVAT